jgi:hypothetical protein
MNRYRHRLPTGPSSSVDVPGIVALGLWQLFQPFDGLLCLHRSSPM